MGGAGHLRVKPSSSIGRVQRPPSVKDGQLWKLFFLTGRCSPLVSRWGRSEEALVLSGCSIYGHENHDSGETRTNLPAQRFW